MVYISYDSTNKNSQAGDVEFVEYGAAKIDVGLPIINYSMAYDMTDRLPLFYESYPGSIPDVSQFGYMVNKAKAYGYKHIGFILDRGYFSEKNIMHMDANSFAFVIMIKGRKKLVRSIIEEQLHSFEKKSSCYIEEDEVFGCTVERKLFESDSKDRYIHLFHSASGEAREMSRFNDDLRKMKKAMDKVIGKATIIPRSYGEYFDLYYNDVEIKVKGKKSEIQKIFVEFIALIIRARFYNKLHDHNVKQTSKHNYMTVPAAIKELEKIMMIKLPDGRYHQSYSVTKTQKTILSAFGMTESSITEAAKKISDLLQEVDYGKIKKADN